MSHEEELPPSQDRRVADDPPADPPAADAPPAAEDSATDGTGSGSATGSGTGTSDRGARSGNHSRGRRARPRERRPHSLLGEVVLVVVLSLALSALIKTYLVQAFFIPSGSMEQTLQVGDRILVNKLAPRFHDLSRGDVVVFEDPGGWLRPDEIPQRSGVRKVVHDVLVGVGVLPSDTAGDLVKRIIGIPGDHVVCCDAKGRITINGKPLDESAYLYPGNTASQIPFDVTVPPGRLWVMGDHREVSQDSRFHQNDPLKGMVPINDVVGRVFVVIWPLDRFEGVSRPAVFDPLDK